MIIKVKMLANLDNDSYVDTWLDTDCIQGFFIPVDEFQNAYPEDVNLIIGGEVQTFQSEDHLSTWLLNNFVNKAVKL